jgi:hypothetical protein
MVNMTAQSNTDKAPPRRPRAARRAERERLFCTRVEAALFLGVSVDAIKSRTKRGTMVGIARAIDGSLWRPAGGAQVLIEAAVLRLHLSEPTRELFDAWTAGRVSLASVKRQLRSEARGRR